jgi:hypothetical protein
MAVCEQSAGMTLALDVIAGKTPRVLPVFPMIPSNHHLCPPVLSNANHGMPVCQPVPGQLSLDRSANAGSTA